MRRRRTSLLPGFPAAALCAALIAGSLSCGDGSTDPDLPGGPGPSSIAFTLDDTTLVEFSGPGAWPPSGTGVIARMDSSGTVLQIGGYRQTAGKGAATAGPEQRFDVIFLEVSGIAPLAPGTYVPTAAVVGRDIPIAALDSLGYAGTAGELTLTSVTSGRIAGTFFGSASRASDSATITVTAGSFDAAWARGLFSLDDTGGTGGSILISVGTGINPVYAWEGGPVYALSVARAVTPGTLVWGVVTAGGDSISSGLAHGSVPAGAVRIANGEPVLTPGVAYRVTVGRVGGTYGYTEFVP